MPNELLDTLPTTEIGRKIDEPEETDGSIWGFLISDMGRGERALLRRNQPA